MRPERGERVGWRWCFVIDIEPELEWDESGSNVHHFPGAIASPGYSLFHTCSRTCFSPSLSPPTPSPQILPSSGVLGLAPFLSSKQDWFYQGCLVVQNELGPVSSTVAQGARQPKRSSCSVKTAPHLLSILSPLSWALSATFLPAGLLWVVGTLFSSDLIVTTGISVFLSNRSLLGFPSRLRPQSLLFADLYPPPTPLPRIIVQGKIPRTKTPCSHLVNFQLKSSASRWVGSGSDLFEQWEIKYRAFHVCLAPVETSILWVPSTGSNSRGNTQPACLELFITLVSAHPVSADVDKQISQGSKSFFHMWTWANSQMY